MSALPLTTDQLLHQILQECEHADAGGFEQVSLPTLDVRRLVKLVQDMNRDNVRLRDHVLKLNGDALAAFMESVKLAKKEQKLASLCALQTFKLVHCQQMLRDLAVLTFYFTLHVENWTRRKDVQRALSKLPKWMLPKLPKWFGRVGNWWELR